MRVSKEYKETARRKMVEAAGRGFRQSGYGGLGVDGLAKVAGVTSGAFYGHFKSKDEAFRAATVQGMVDYRENVKKLQAAHGQAWLAHFLDYYLGDTHIHQVDASCAVPALSADVMRADPKTKAEYEMLLEQIASTIAQGLPRPDIHTARALMALLSGAVLMARAVADKKSARIIAKSSRKAADQLIATMEHR